MCFFPAESGENRLIPSFLQCYKNQPFVGTEPNLSVEFSLFRSEFSQIRYKNGNDFKCTQSFVPDRTGAGRRSYGQSVRLFAATGK